MCTCMHNPFRYYTTYPITHASSIFPLQPAFTAFTFINPYSLATFYEIPTFLAHADLFSLFCIQFNAAFNFLRGNKWKNVTLTCRTPCSLLCFRFILFPYIFLQLFLCAFKKVNDWFAFFPAQAKEQLSFLPRFHSKIASPLPTRIPTYLVLNDI